MTDTRLDHIEFEEVPTGIQGHRWIRYYGTWYKVTDIGCLDFEGAMRSREKQYKTDDWWLGMEKDRDEAPPGEIPPSVPHNWDIIIPKEEDNEALDTDPDL